MARLRADNRKNLEVRPLAFVIRPLDACEGSSTVEHGLTRVECQLCGPRDVRLTRNTMDSLPSTSVLQHKAALNVSVYFAPFSGGERRRRSKSDRRSLEMASAIKNTFESVIQTALYPRSQIDISLLVIQADGSLLSTAINAVSLATIHAGIALTSPVSSITLSALHDQLLLDPCSTEETDLPTVTIACLAPGLEKGQATGKICLVNMETRLSIDRFEAMLRLGAEGCAVISTEIDRAARQWVGETAEQMLVTEAKNSTSRAMDEDP